MHRQIDDNEKIITQKQISPHFQNDLVFKSKLHQGYKGILDLLKDKDHERHSTAVTRNRELKELLAQKKKEHDDAEEDSEEDNVRSVAQEVDY